MSLDLKSSFINLFCDLKLTCQICGKEIFDGKYFCSECEDKLVFNNKSICDHCGRQTLQNYPYCIECKTDSTAFEKARSIFCYEGEIKKLISGFKNDDKRYLADIFTEFFLPYYYKFFFRTDYIIFVPMHQKDQKIRGYNQSELLAEKLAVKVNKMIAYGVIEKIKETKNQKSLTKKERLLNLKGAFIIRKRKIIENKNILLIDDIFTTGITAHTIAQKLIKAGAETVNVLTVASVSASNRTK
jgi:ComF family protein